LHNRLIESNEQESKSVRRLETKDLENGQKVNC